MRPWDGTPQDALRFPRIWGDARHGSQVVSRRRGPATLARIEADMRDTWRRMHFCRRNSWGWRVMYRNRLLALIALRHAYRDEAIG